MDNNTPVAPEAPAQPTVAAPSEATPNTNLEVAPQAPVTPPAPAPNIPADKVEAFNRFVLANGGFDKAFSKMKTDIATGNIVRAEETAASESQQVQNSVPPMPQVEKGFMSPLELSVRRYGQDLATEYKALGDYVAKGEFMDDMQNMGMRTVDSYGNINVKGIRDFLDLKAQVQAAQAPKTPVTATPTVEYYNVDNGNITSMDQALAITKQNMDLRNRGVAEHPLTKQAQEYMSQYFATKAGKVKSNKV